MSTTCEPPRAGILLAYRNKAFAGIGVAQTNHHRYRRHLPFPRSRVFSRVGAHDVSDDGVVSWREQASCWAKELDPPDAASELSRLSSEITRHDCLYYNDAAPEITDDEYDLLRIRLEALEHAHPTLVKQDSPTRRVGSPLSSSRDLDAPLSARHSVPMLSLQNAFNAAEVHAFVHRVRRQLGGAYAETADGIARTPLRLCAEPKIDGASACVRYENGILVRCVSRGDGETGEDVTQQLMGAIGIPAQLSGDPQEYPRILEVRGEVFISDHDFEAVNDARNAAGMRRFKNSRNAVAGAMRRSEPQAGDGTDAGPLRFMVYSWGEVVCPPEQKWRSQSSFLSCVRRFGLISVPLLAVSDALEDVMREQELLCDAERRNSLGYRVDGVVYKVDDVTLHPRLGSDSRAPRWAVAHKFPAATASTTISAVDVQIGRTGALTPVAILSPPVELGGTTVSRATLHNFGEIKRKGLTIGSRVVVERAGDVIPHIVGLAEGSHVADDGNTDSTKTAAWIPPEYCPSCGSKVRRQRLAETSRQKLKDPQTNKPEAKAGLSDEANSAEVEPAVSRCTGGLRCPSQVVERIVHFVSRDAFDIPGLSRQRIRQLHDKDIISSPADLFTLEERFLRRDVEPVSELGKAICLEDYSSLPEFWIYTSGTDKGKLKRSTMKLFDAIMQTAKGGVPLQRFIYSLGISQVGRYTAKLIAEKYVTFAQFREVGEMEAARISIDSGEYKKFPSPLMDIDGIGPIVAQSIGEFWAERANVIVIDELLAAGVVILDYVSHQNTRDTLGTGHRAYLRGLRVVVTGAIPGMTHDQAFAAVEAAGGTAQRTISTKTDLLVLGEGSGRKKVVMAKERGTKVIDANSFLRVLGIDREEEAPLHLK